MQLLVLLLIFLLHSSHNEYCIHSSLSWHKSKLRFIQIDCVCICLFNTLSTIFMACSRSFTPLCDPQIITSLFPLKMSTITLVFYLPGILLPSNTRWHNSIITLTPISPLATIISTLTSDGLPFLFHFSKELEKTIRILIKIIHLLISFRSHSLSNNFSRLTSYMFVFSLIFF